MESFAMQSLRQSAMNKACLKLIGEQLAAETMARAALIRAQHRLRGKRLSYVDSLNAALDAMMREGSPN